MSARPLFGCLARGGKFGALMGEVLQFEESCNKVLGMGTLQAMVTGNSQFFTTTASLARGKREWQVAAVSPVEWNLHGMLKPPGGVCGSSMWQPADALIHGASRKAMVPPCIAPFLCVFQEIIWDTDVACVTRLLGEHELPHGAQRGWWADPAT